MQFQYPLNLHCSQTQREHMALSRRFNTLWIYTALKLWGDSRMELLSFNTLWIYTALKHRSRFCSHFLSFNTLWIYTALKLLRFWKNPLKVSIPSEFTLLSNLVNSAIAESWFQYPLNLHCSQTSARLSKTTPSFNTLWIYTALKHTIDPYRISCVSIPSEFTLLSNDKALWLIWYVFQYPLNLHCSQTVLDEVKGRWKFQYPLNLHCSQTDLLSFDL